MLARHGYFCFRPRLRALCAADIVGNAFWAHPPLPFHHASGYAFDATQRPLRQQLGRCRVKGKAGEGAPGTLYRAHDPLLVRDLAINLAHIDTMMDPLKLPRVDRAALYTSGHESVRHRARPHPYSYFFAAISLRLCRLRRPRQRCGRIHVSHHIDDDGTIRCERLSECGL